MIDVFKAERHTQIDRENSYILSYPHLLSYFESKQRFSVSDFVRGAHIVYGWMPTILELYRLPAFNLEDGAEVLSRAKRTQTLSDADVDSLARIVNNSLTGASKLLHFVAPEGFAIWDSKIFTGVTGEKPHAYRVRKVANYRHYLGLLSEIRNDRRFPKFHASVNKKIGYDVSSFCAIELVMYLNGADSAC